MQDRQKIGNGKSSKIIINNQYAGMTWDEFLNVLLTTGLLCDISATPISTGGVNVMGTALNTLNLCSDELAERFGYSGDQEIDAVTPNDILNKIKDNYDDDHTILHISIPASAWVSSGTAGVLKATVINQQIKSTSNPDYDLDDARNYNKDKQKKMQSYFSAISDMVTANGSVTFYIVDLVPDISLPIKLKGV